MRLFGTGGAERLMASSLPDDTALESKMVSRAIQSAQAQVEGRNAEQRKNVLKYDDVLNRQREAIYGDRRRILEGDDLHEKVQFFLEDTLTAMIDAATAEGNGDDWDFHALWSNLRTIFPISITPQDVIDEAGGKPRVTVEMLKEEVISDAKLIYAEREAQIGPDTMRDLERRVVLSVIGRKWQEHLYEMDYLKEGIGLRAMAQRDPLVEYQREGYAMFQTMMEGIREESVGFLFNLEIESTQEGQQTSTPAQSGQLEYSAPAEDGSTETHVEQARSRASQNGGGSRSAGPKPAQKKNSSRPSSKGAPGRRSKR
jgi:preprotein translocase subunit SecA